MAPVTILDASALAKSSTSEEYLEFAKRLVHHLQRNGFVVLRNHGISPASIKTMFDKHAQFFSLPHDIKMTIAHPGGSAPARGYSPYGKEKTFVLRPDLSKPQTGAIDAREQLAIGPPEDKTWPMPWLDGAHAPGFREYMDDFYGECRAIGRVLVSAIEVGLSLRASTITERYLPDAAEFNMNYYPSIPLGELEKATTKRIWPHSDLGILSMLFQDRVGGLEFEDREQPGRFIPVACHEVGDMVVNVADTLERWTNGFFKAGVHRVVPPSASTAEHSRLRDSGAENSQSMVAERRSAVMFYRASGGTSVGSMPEFVTADRPALFEDITAIQYLQSKNKHLY